MAPPDSSCVTVSASLLWASIRLSAQQGDNVAPWVSEEEQGAGVSTGLNGQAAEVQRVQHLTWVTGKAGGEARLVSLATLPPALNIPACCPCHCCLPVTSLVSQPHCPALCERRVETLLASVFFWKTLVNERIRSSPHLQAAVFHIPRQTQETWWLTHPENAGAASGRRHPPSPGRVPLPEQ